MQFFFFFCSLGCSVWSYLGCQVGVLSSLLLSLRLSASLLFFFLEEEEDGRGRGELFDAEWMSIQVYKTITHTLWKGDENTSGLVWISFIECDLMHCELNVMWELSTITDEQKKKVM